MWMMRALTVTAVCLGVLSCSQGTRQQGAATQAPAAVVTPQASVSLACDGGRFSRFRLKNTKSRSYSAGLPSTNRCDLTDKAEGVVWVATGDGLELAGADKKLTFKDEQGRELRYTCWTSSGTINDVAQTELLLYGPADAARVTVCCGAACAEAAVE